MAPSKRWVGIVGVLALLTPRLVLALHAKLNLLGFRNTENVEPSPWLVRVTRLAGVAVVLFAIVGPEDSMDTESADGPHDRIEFV